MNNLKLPNWSKSSWWLIYAGLVVITIGAANSPVLNSNDAYFYAVISKTIYTSQNWVELFYAGHDWLDKPHLPFWLTALSFKWLGVTPFAYSLPGLLFHVLGAYYTYFLAKLLFERNTAKLAVLFYLSCLHLLLSAIDVRAEAYLLGEIIPACYYWLRYDRESRYKHLILGSLFTGLALMTKGLFVVVPIFSGIVALWLYQGRILQLVRPKWLIAYALCLLVAMPELICLYWQFDAHPNKIVFGRTHVSGLAWYFWGSQFGRFFNSGPIVNNHGNPFFFVHTSLWAMLPWTLLVLANLVWLVRHFKRLTITQRLPLIYLIASFGLSFFMFSATKFQLDHYTNILFPFVMILIAYWLPRSMHLTLLAGLQLWLSRLLLLAIIVICLFLWFSHNLHSFVIVLPMLAFIFSYLPRFSRWLWGQLILWPTLAIGLVFLVLIQINNKLYPQFSSGYQVAQLTNMQPQMPIYCFGAAGNINQLTFYAKAPVHKLKTLSQLSQSSAYLLINARDLAHLALPKSAWLVKHLNYLPQEKFIPALLTASNYTNSIESLNLYEIRP